MRFKDIPYHEEIKRRLVEMADSGRVPHALMLEGPSGSAKYALCRALVQYLHCTDRRDGDSCGRCVSCRQHEKFNHIDTYYSFPVVKKSPRPGISNEYAYEFHEFITGSPYMDFEQWLEALDNINAQPQIYVDEGLEISRWLSFTAAQSEYKAVIMWLPERMREDAANKLLKMIEEPTNNSIFVMSSDNSRMVLPTVYSRLQRISVPRYSSAEVEEILVNSYCVARESAQSIAQIANGDINRAISLIKVSKQRAKFLELFMTLMRKAYSRSMADLKQWSLDVAALGREPIIAFFEYCSSLIRENFILNLHNKELESLTPEERAFCTKFAKYIHERNVLGFIETFDKAKIDIAGNANPKVVCFDVTLRVILLLLK